MRLKNYLIFILDYLKFNKLSLDSKLKPKWKYRYPCLNDKAESTPVDPHYFYQGVWAFEKIRESKTRTHIDIGSDIRLIGLLSLITKVTFFDIRPPRVRIDNLVVKEGNILKLPLKSNSVNSLSCLHVAEHVGLGRYGDKLDPYGTKKACCELTRVLAHGGNLLFSVPVGKERVCFNAHRIHTPETIINYFEDLESMEVSGVTDAGEYIRNVDISILNKSKYALGLFWFKKPRNEK